MVDVEISLGDDLMAQVELTGGKLPDDVSSKSLKFDAKGTPHVMYRDEDGKLLKDTPIRSSAIIEEKFSATQEVLQEATKLHEDNSRMYKKTNIIFYAFIGMIALSLGYVILTTLMR